MTWTLNRSENYCQPCPEYKGDGCGDLYNVHECPLCGGERRFCNNCATDHHQNGWNSCNHDYRNSRMGLCPRNHPECIRSFIEAAKQNPLNAIFALLDLSLLALSNSDTEEKKAMCLKDIGLIKSAFEVESNKITGLPQTKELENEKT